jgi:hypothetical protein
VGGSARSRWAALTQFNLSVGPRPNHMNGLEQQLMDTPLHGYETALQAPTAAGVYAAWLDGEPRCLYVGRSDNLSSRPRSHYAGGRGGDQFCLYVYDRFIHSLRPPAQEPISSDRVNTMTRDWIRRRVRFRWLPLASAQSRRAEDLLRRSLKPILNPAAGVPQ